MPRIQRWFHDNVFLITIILLIFIIGGRFTIPTRPIIGTWPSIYEAFAHILLGGVAVVGFYEPGRTRWLAWGGFVVASFLIELPKALNWF